MMCTMHKGFLEILCYIEPYISPQESVRGIKIITASERLALTIRFLATGESFSSITYQFRISERAISYIVLQVAGEIACHVGKEFLKMPSSSQEWLAISEAFERRWQFPNCIGAVDGKHVVIMPPPGTSSEYFNYKKTFSIILLAVAGSNGRMNDSGVWNNSDLRKKIENTELGIPEDAP